METPSNIEVSGRATVTLTWDDGPTEISARRLRAACVCADCRSDVGAARTEKLLASGVPITIDGAELRGAYAISFRFGPDGHGTGIFTWDLLRTLGGDEDGPTTP